MFIFVLVYFVSEGNQASYLQTESPQFVGSGSNLNSVFKALIGLFRSALHVCPVWDLGSNLFCSVVLKAFGILLKVRSMHMQLGCKPRNSYTTSQDHILELSSLHNLLNTFLLPGTSSPGLLTSFLALLFTSCTCIYLKGPVAR